MDGRLDTRQQERHRFQSRNQQNHRQRRILRRHRLHRLHFLVRQHPYRFSPLLRPYASCQCIQGRSYSSWEWCVDPYAGKKDIETWKSWGEPEFYDTLYQPFFFSDLGYDRNHYTKIKIAETRHLGKAHGRKAPAKFTCATTFTRTYCIRPILESTGPTAQRADNKWTGIQLERVDCSFMQNVPLSAPLYRLDMLCTCRGASGESGS